MSELMGQFSAYRKNPYYDKIKNDPILSVFYQIVSYARHTHAHAGRGVSFRTAHSRRGMTRSMAAGMPRRCWMT